MVTYLGSLNYFKIILEAQSWSLLVFAPNMRYRLLHLIKAEDVSVDEVRFHYRYSRTATFLHSQ